MKTKFFILTFFLLFSRGCDFYSTSLWFFQPNGAEGETNPLTSVFGFGFNGLVASNIILIALIIYAFYYYSFKYQAKKLNHIPANFIDYASEVYFHQKGKLFQVFYKIPKDKKTAMAHFGYVMIRVIIFGSFLATFHNLCQFYNVPFYNTFREIVIRPLFVIYGLVALSFIYFQYRILNKEYQTLKYNFKKIEY
ncbi:MAG: hypothetical protein U0W65_02330 [Bacteroidia bacterium]|nr:hypothetical protein [Bacteroidia bacterium]